MSRFATGLAALLCIAPACSRSLEEPKVRGGAPAPSGTLALGEKITSPMVSLATIAKDPAGYRSRTIATSGKVTAVCREMGCWLELEDGSGHAHVKIHGHTFFVPRTAPGHVARVQATVIAATAAADDCEEQDPQNGIAKIELDATGVEID
jgi:hypothetical protein